MEALGLVDKKFTFTANPAMSTGNTRLANQSSEKPTTFLLLTMGDVIPGLPLEPK